MIFFDKCSIDIFIYRSYRSYRSDRSNNTATSYIEQDELKVKKLFYNKTS